MKIEFTDLNYGVNKEEKKLHIIFNRKVTKEEREKHFFNNEEFFYEISFSFTFLYYMDSSDLDTIYKLAKKEIENMVDEGGISTKEINKASLFLYEMVLNSIYSFNNLYELGFSWERSVELENG